MSMVGAEMPRYKCHKEVFALKIGYISRNEDGSGTIGPENPFAPFNVSKEYMDKHSPTTNGYYVVYQDGYTSYSPAEAFEDGYTRI